MRKWLIILLLTISSFMGTSISSGSQMDSRKLTKNVQIKQLVEWMSISSIGYNYLLDTYGLNQTNMPNGFPMEINKLNRISDEFGMRFHPIFNCWRMHNGVDLSGMRGTPILATADGVIDKVAYSVGYGRMVVIDHGNDVKTVYAHLKKFNVKKGQKVSMGDQIAELGNSGASTGAHLHYEVKVGEEAINPFLLVCKDNSTNEDIIKNYQKIEDERNRQYALCDDSQKSH